MNNIELSALNRALLAWHGYERHNSEAEIWLKPNEYINIMHDGFIHAKGPFKPFYASDDLNRDLTKFLQKMGKLPKLSNAQKKMLIRATKTRIHYMGGTSPRVFFSGSSTEKSPSILTFLKLKQLGLFHGRTHISQSKINITSKGRILAQYLREVEG